MTCYDHMLAVICALAAKIDDIRGSVCRKMTYFDAGSFSHIPYSHCLIKAATDLQATQVRPET